MPIYDYTCSNCRRVTEVIHGINDHGPKFCPECGAEGTMTKKFVAPTVHFKGSGWAKKDRSSSTRAARAKDDKGTSGDSTSTGSAAESGTDGTKTDTKKSDAGSSGGSSASSTGDSSAATGSSD